MNKTTKRSSRDLLNKRTEILDPGDVTEIEENDFTLNVLRYVDTFEKSRAEIQSSASTGNN